MTASAIAGRTVLAGILLALGSGVGWWAREMRGWPAGQQPTKPPGAPSATPAAGAVPPPPLTKPPVEPPPVSAAPPVPAGAKLKALLRSSTPFNDLPAILKEIDRLTLEEAPSAVRELREMTSDGRLPRGLGDTVLMASLSRLADLSPRRAVQELTFLWRTRDQGAAAILERVAAKDPLAAEKLLRGDLGDALGPKADSLAAKLTSAWAATDYEGARAWAENQTGRARDNALLGLLGAAFHRDPAAAMQIFDQIQHTEDQSQARWQLLDLWAARDPSQALAFAAGASEKSLNEEHRLLFRRWAEKDIQGSLTAFATLPPEIRRHTAETLVDVWAEDDPVAAARWIQDQPSEVQSFNALSQAAIGWAVRDPAAASEWIGSLPPGEARQGAIFGLVTSQSDRDSPSAVAWAEQLTDPAIRQRALGSSFAKWNRTDPAAAQAWLEKTSSLSPGQKAALHPAGR